MLTSHRRELLGVAVLWTLIMLGFANAVLGTVVGACLGGVGPGAAAAIQACHDAAREQQWGILAKPWVWPVILVAGWLGIAWVDALWHRRTRGSLGGR